jgi:hypothetical protein
MGLFGITEETAKQMLGEYFNNAKKVVEDGLNVLKKTVDEYVAKVDGANKKLGVQEGKLSELEARLGQVRQQMGTVVEDVQKEILARYGLRPVEQTEVPFEELAKRVGESAEEARYKALCDFLRKREKSEYSADGLKVSSEKNDESYNPTLESLNNTLVKLGADAINPKILRCIRPDNEGLLFGFELLTSPFGGTPNKPDSDVGYSVKFIGNDYSARQLSTDTGAMEALGARLATAWYLGVAEQGLKEYSNVDNPKYKEAIIINLAQGLSKLLNAKNMHTQIDNLEAFGREFIQNYPLAANYIDLGYKTKEWVSG